MPATEKDLLDFFETHALPYQIFRHPPLHTVEDSKAQRGILAGGHCKNMFLKDKSGQTYLVVCLEDRRIRIRDLEKLLGAKRMTFGAPERMAEVLGVTPGAVTPFALINDMHGPEGASVRLILDAQMMAFDLLNYHPLHNEATVAMTAKDVRRFFDLTGHHPTEVDFDALEEKARQHAAQSALPQGASTPK